MDSVKNIVIVGVIVFIFINFIINKNLREFIKKFLNLRILKFNFTIGTLLLAFIIVGMSLNIFSYAIILVDNIRIVNMSTEKIDEVLEVGYKNSEEERLIYKEIMKQDTNINNCKSPYIPDGFKYIEGQWDTGFVIESSKGNQFVWIPCTNIVNDIGINILERSDFSPDAFIKSFLCYEDDEEYIIFLESAIQNGGFYISRYEIGKDENGKPVSKKGYKIWTNITKEEAKEKAELIENNINSKLINGYAYDTAFNFIYNQIDINEYYESKETAGTKSLKNIYDLTDNMYEFTTEMQFSSIIYRGIIVENEYVDTNLIDNRLVTSEDYFAENLGFRTILYK